MHDLRHAFAVKRYQQTHDMYALEKALGRRMSRLGNITSLEIRTQ